MSARYPSAGIRDAFLIALHVNDRALLTRLAINLTDCTNPLTGLIVESTRSAAGLDVAQALAVRQLRKGHAAELIRATEIAHAMIAVSARRWPKRLPRQMLHQFVQTPTGRHA